MLALACNCFVPKAKLKEWHARLKEEGDKESDKAWRKEFKIF